MKLFGRGINSLLVLVLVLLFLSSPAFSLKKLLTVPFLCQAPFGDWGEPYQEACEEASLIMAVFYFENRPLDFMNGEKEILKLVKFQENKYGGHFDLPAEKVAELIRDYYKLKNIRVVYDIKVEDILRELSSNNLVIVPAAGRKLANPYYTPPGPLYHNLLIIGFDDKKGEFITNDCGTKRGRNYRYKYNRVYDAIHDWTGTSADGRKAMIVIGRD